jgi:hypothetical protein
VQSQELCHESAAGNFEIEPVMITRSDGTPLKLQVEVIASLSAAEALVAGADQRTPLFFIADENGLREETALNAFGQRYFAALSLAPNELLLAGFQGRVERYDPTTGVIEPVVTPTTAWPRITRLVASPDGRELFAGAKFDRGVHGSTDRLMLLELDRSAPGGPAWTLHQVGETLDPETSVDVSWVGPRIALAAFGSAFLAQLDGGILRSLPTPWPAGSVFALGQSANGTLVAGESAQRSTFARRVGDDWEILAQQSFRRTFRIFERGESFVIGGESGWIGVGVRYKDQWLTCAQRVHPNSWSKPHVAATGDQTVWMGGTDNTDNPEPSSLYRIRLGRPL